MNGPDELIAKIIKYNPGADVALIQKAYDFAGDAHKDQKRLSGEPYITHPLEVAKILAELEQDQPTIIASLLHDTVEDAKIDKTTIVKLFGADVAYLVEGVTKLGKLVFESREERQAENFRKMILAMGEDIRVVIIKLADRMHNMQTLRFIPPQKQMETAIETREIFAPLAHRLGMWKVKWELEDLSFRYIEPEKYEEIRKKVTERRAEREKKIADFIARIGEILKNVDIKAEISGRPKHFYSIYRKMVEQNLEYEDLYDLLAIRIIVGTVKDCYAVLGLIHAAWKPIPGRFTDYIAMPKLNGYQSLHTTVIGEGGQPVEVQIRTKEMHRIAEIGVAAHWRYKEGGKSNQLDQKMEWLRSILDWQKDLSNSKDFMELLKIDLFTDEVFVFTPKGAVQALPIDSTPVDFAYIIHTEVGHRCLGAKVNSKIVPLDYKLKNGDIVEILTSKNENPSRDWLNFVKTSSARAKIKAYFKKQKREENLERGRLLLFDELKKLHIEPSLVFVEGNLTPVIKECNVTDADDLLVQIGYGELSSYVVAKKLRGEVERHIEVPLLEEDLIKPFLSTSSKRKSNIGVQVAGVSNILIRFSKCCRPIPGEEIIGYVTKGRGVAIHKSDCPNVIKENNAKGRLVNVSWDLAKEISYPVEIEIEAFDRVGVLHDILEKVAETKTNVSAATVKTKKGSSAILKLVVDVKDVTHLSNVLRHIRAVSDVYSAIRKVS